MTPAMTPCHETAYGLVQTTLDALLVVQACCDGALPLMQQRIDDRARRQIRSGAIYVFVKAAVRGMGIRRWTDGYTWTPSRIEGNFLVYFEATPAPSAVAPVPRRRHGGHARRKPPKKRALAFDRLHRALPTEDATTAPDAAAVTSASPATSTTTTTTTTPAPPPAAPRRWRDRDGAEAGGSAEEPAEDPYRVAVTDHTLIKRTFSVRIGGQEYHLVNYHRPCDLKAGLLPLPREQPWSATTRVDAHLIFNPQLRRPATFVPFLPLGPVPWRSLRAAAPPTRLAMDRPPEQAPASPALLPPTHDADDDRRHEASDGFKMPAAHL